MFFRLSWRNIWRNKRRTMITIASVFLAVILAITMKSATNGVYEKLVHDVVTISSGYIQVHKKGYWNEQVIDNSFRPDENLVRKLKSIPGINSFSVRLETFALASSGETTKGVMVIGVDPEKEKLMIRLHEKIKEGNYLKNGEHAALIGEELANKLSLSPGDSIILIGQGYHGYGAAEIFRVNGILKLGSPDLSKRLVYLPLETAQKMYDANGLVTSVSIDLADPSGMETAKERLSQNLDTSLLEIMTWKDMMPELDQLIKADSGGHTISAGVLYLVISFGLFGTILMMTAERIHEMGIMVAIGMKKWLLSLIVTAEIILIAFLAVISGVLFTYPFLRYFSIYPIRFTGDLAEVYENYGMEPVVALSTAPEIFSSQAAVVLIISLILAIYPIIKILRLKPVVAIHS